eukprot:3604458-Prymnesium_polylepis.1
MRLTSALAGRAWRWQRSCADRSPDPVASGRSWSGRDTTMWRRASAARSPLRSDCVREPRPDLAPLQQPQRNMARRGARLRGARRARRTTRPAAP